MTACKATGIIYGRKSHDGFTFHDLRHTFDTNMRRAGVAAVRKNGNDRALHPGNG